MSLPKKIFSIILLLLVSALAVSQLIKNFGQAKKNARIIFAFHRETLYCRCRFDARLQVDLKSCNMQSAAKFKRARRVEWEHMMPAENFGNQFACWREPLCKKRNGKQYRGRACCERIDPKFRQAEAELYNLWPAVGLVNQARSNYRYSKLNPHTTFYGCPITIDSATRRVEPADYAKGIVARANLFMSYKYGIHLSEAQRTLFLMWDTQFPPSNIEKQWAQKVAEVEGYDNPYIVVRENDYLNLINKLKSFFNEKDDFLIDILRAYFK
ncbi:putative endonuclease-1 [Legionella busanensis]|uniref:Putative endonuclease-1 n=1 Tax=Legionella busanensis TaxID=190655 RepID=A0A378JRZ3_9GAMM|nr:endonuclease [Legionella busanensis]STX50912.1 putative endonuclease-1 [Legionella busanensis]